MSEARILENTPVQYSQTSQHEHKYVPDSPASAHPIPGEVRALATPPPAIETAARKTTKAKAKPTHYKVVCISLYTQDIENLEATVAELKRRGHTKANKSQLIRQALRQLDIDKLPPPQQ